MSRRGRVLVLVTVVVLVVALAGGYLWRAHRSQAAARAGAPAVRVRADLDAVLAGPHLVFRSTAPGPGLGRVAAVPLAAPGGPRALTPVSCDRVYATRAEAVCLSAGRQVVTASNAQLLDGAWAHRQDLPLVGIPSRARLSPDGSLVVTTSFVSGDSYANLGTFSTRTVISRSTGAIVDDLEEYQLVVDGRTVDAADRNLWGVTFADDDTFYATAASGGRTWLVKGSLSAHRLTALREDAECPSLSPDHTRIAFKKHGTLPAGRWRLAVYDLASGRETVLAETRSVDDQAEWRDNGHLLYGLPRTATSSDIWEVPADGTGTPALLVPEAWSPAVVR